MKAISIQQPWAWLIVHGIKPVENRVWTTGYRGPLLIHAGLRIDRDGYAAAREIDAAAFDRLPSELTIPLVGIVGRVELVDIVRDHSSPWFFGKYGFVLANPTPLPFRKLKGALGLFDVS